MRYAAILLFMVGCAHVTHEQVGEDARPRLLRALDELAADGVVLVAGDRAFVLPPDLVESERQMLAAALAKTISSPPVGKQLRVASDPDSRVSAFHYPNRFLEVEQRDATLVVERLDWVDQDGYWIVCATSQGERYAFLTCGGPELDKAWDRLEDRASELAGDHANGPPLFLPSRMPTAGGSLRSIGIDLRGAEGRIVIQGTTFEVIR